MLNGVEITKNKRIEEEVYNDVENHMKKKR